MLQVQRLIGHSLVNVSGGDIPGEFGAPKRVPPSISHDLTMNSHVPSFEGEMDVIAGWAKAKHALGDWKETVCSDFVFLFALFASLFLSNLDELARAPFNGGTGITVGLA